MQQRVAATAARQADPPSWHGLSIVPCRRRLDDRGVCWRSPHAVWRAN